MQTVSSVLSQLTLVDFRRTRGGGVQTFYFTFWYKEKQYILRHEFEYYSAGVKHHFRFQKPWFVPKPFSLSQNDFVELSEDLMKIVNKRKLGETSVILHAVN